MRQSGSESVLIQISNLGDRASNVQGEGDSCGF